MNSNLSKNQDSELRYSKDRRLKRFPSLKWLLFGGRRSQVRREGERKEIRFLDRYPATIFVQATVIILLSVIDAFLTLFLITHGAIEINPIMNFSLRQGPLFFMLSKYLLTSLGVILLVVFSHTFLHYARINTRVIIPFAISIFSAVILWEIYLIWRHLV